MKKTPAPKINSTALRKIFSKFSQIKLAYLFGSRATGNYGPMSDYDFAFYLEEKDPMKRFNISIDIDTALSRFFKTNDIDIVILNDSEMPDLKFNIINEGKLIYKKEPYKVIVEPKIISEYLDFNQQLFKHCLTASL